MQNHYSGGFSPITPKPSVSPMIWVSLIGLFGLLITVTLLAYFAPSKQVDDYSESETLKAYAMSHALKEMGASPLGLEDSGIKVSQQVAREATTKVESAEIYTAAQTVLNEPVPDASLTLLLKSKDPAVRAFGKIYRAKSLTPEQAKQLSARLPAESWYEVASAEAYRKAKVANPYLTAVTPNRARLYILGGGLFMAFIFGGGIVWIVYIALRAAGRLIPKGHPAEPMSPGNADRFAARSLILLVGFVAISLFEELVSEGLKIVAGDSVASMTGQLASSLALVALAFSVFLLTPGGQKISPRDYGWSTQGLGRKVIWGLGAAMSIGPLYLITTTVDNLLFRSLPQEAHPIAIELAQNRNFWAFLAIGFIASVCAPIFEETLFRGTLLPALSTRLKSIALGIVVSSFLFASLHPTGPPSWLLLGGIGAISAGLMYQTRSIIPSIVMHAAFNFLMLVMVLLIG